jgi:hypothetical protein
MHICSPYEPDVEVYPQQESSTYTFLGGVEKGVKN